MQEWIEGDSEKKWAGARVIGSEGGWRVLRRTMQLSSISSQHGISPVVVMETEKGPSHLFILRYLWPGTEDIHTDLYTLICNHRCRYYTMRYMWKLTCRMLCAVHTEIV